MNCFILGIIKGLYERNDATYHFGSLMSFREHLQNAEKAGVIDENSQLTEKGREIYHKKNLQKYKIRRAYQWSIDDE